MFYVRSIHRNKQSSVISIQRTTMRLNTYCYTSQNIYHHMFSDDKLAYACLMISHVDIDSHENEYIER